MAVWQRLAAGFAIATILAVAFLAYLRPDFVLDVATRVISCF